MLWLDDPAERTVHVVDAAGERNAGETVTSDLLPGFSVAVGGLFP